MIKCLSNSLPKTVHMFRGYEGTITGKERFPKEVFI